MCCRKTAAGLLGVFMLATLACRDPHQDKKWVAGKNTAAADARAGAKAEAATDAQDGATSANDPGGEPAALQPVSSVDLSRYMGKWYEIARYPNSFQKGLVGVIAEYRLREDGEFDVINTGREKTLDGPLSRSTATGWVQDEKTNAKLWVQFIWPFRAHYWIIDLCPEYSYAVVGQPSRKYLWILSRTPQMDEEAYAAICERLRKQGYDPSRLQMTLQPPA